MNWHIQLEHFTFHLQYKHPRTFAHRKYEDLSWRRIWRDGQFEKSFLCKTFRLACVRAFPMLVNKIQL